MKRRDVLTVVAGATAGVVGCVGVSDDNTETPVENGKDDKNTDDSEDDSRYTEGDCDEVASDVAYERCDHRIVSVSDLPEPAECEALAAIETDRYVTDDGLLLPEVVAVENVHLVHEDTYYEIEVTENATLLQLAERLPTFEEDVTLENMREDDVTIHIRIEHEESDDVPFEKELDLGPGETVTLNEDVAFLYGTYRAEIGGEELSAEHTWEITWELNYAYEVGHAYPIELDGHGVFSDPAAKNYKYGPCRWDEGGEVTHGH